MRALQLHQALVDAGMPSAGSARAYVQNLCQRLGTSNSSSSTTTGGLKQQFFSLLTHLLKEAPSLASSWVTDYLACGALVSSSDPEESYVLQPQAVLAWCQEAAAGLEGRVGAFLRAGPSAGGVAVLDLQQAAQSLLSIATAVQAVISGSRSEVQSLLSKLQQLQHTARVLQVLEQLQQQQLGSPSAPTQATLSGTALQLSSAGGGSSCGFGQQPLFRPGNAAQDRWRQQLSQRRAAAVDGHLFLDDLLQQLQKQQGSLGDNSPALQYPYPDVLTCISTLFAGGSSSGGSSGGSSGSGEGGSGGVWHARLAVLLYYLLDGGWLGSAEPFAQGFQLPLTLVQEWQCSFLLDAATGGSSAEGAAAGSSGSSTALDSACRLLGAIACPSTPFRFVEALLQAGRPATALAVQRARCAGGGSSSGGLGEAQVLLRVQLGCGLLAEGFCDLRRHCEQVPASDRPKHVNTLMRQLVEWALAAAPTATSSSSAAAATASRMQQQLRLQDSSAAAAAAGVGGDGSSKTRQQQLLQLPLNAGEEAVLVAVLRERMTAGKTGGHLLPLYLLQRGRTLEALSAYAAYKASAAAAGPASQGGPDATSDASTAAAASRAALHARLDGIMAAAAANLPPALRTAATAAGSSSGVRPVLQGLQRVSEAQQQLLGSGVGGLVLQQRGLEPPAFVAPLMYEAAVFGSSTGAASGLMAGTPAGLRQAGQQARSGLSSGKAASGSQKKAVLRAVEAGGAATGSAVKPQLLFGDEAGAAGQFEGNKENASLDAAAMAPPLFGVPAAAGAADLNRQALFATPQPQAATPATGRYNPPGQRSYKRLRQTPI